jgi:hypothetical protein
VPNIHAAAAILMNFLTGIANLTKKKIRAHRTQMTDCENLKGLRSTLGTINNGQP